MRGRLDLRFVACFVAGMAMVATAQKTKPYTHKWDTVADVMGMHGKSHDQQQPTDAEVAFMANNYVQITTGSTCTNHNKSFVLEDYTLTLARRIKAVNPNVKVGMYWRLGMALEIATCSRSAPIWLAHPEWRLKDDNGAYVTDNGNYCIDYTNPAASAFYASVLVNVTRPTLADGSPVLDYVYTDNGGFTMTRPYAKGIGPKRSLALIEATINMVHSIQTQLNALGHQRNVYINSMDTEETAGWHTRSGASGSMFDHWSILQFTDQNNGSFNIPMMVEGIELARNPMLSNQSIQIKGWPGPISAQKDQYPPNMVTPTTPAEFKAIAAQRFNSELALYLLVAEATTTWVYSFFWVLYDYIPGNPASTVPDNFFPQTKCPLGPPLNAPARKPNTWVYTREYQHASVYVDLNDRNASKVTFHNCDA